MMKRCPNCGEWCEVEERGFIKRATDGFGNSAGKAAEIGASIGELFGKRGKKVGAYLGGAVSGGTGLSYIRALSEALVGDEYVYKCANCGFEWTADTEEVFNSEDELETAFDEWYDKIEELNELPAKIKYAEATISQFPTDSIEQAYAYGTLGLLYQEIEDFESAIKCFIEGVGNRSVEFGATNYGDICYQIYMCYMGLGNLDDARKWCLRAALYADDTNKRETSRYGQVTVNEESNNDFRQLDDEFTSSFLELPYKNRKALLIVDGFNDLFQNNFQVLSIDSDLSHLSFPVGHPKVNEMYIAHPLTTNRYMPIEGYQFELIEDRVREFCELAQSLGATEINIECLNSNTNDSSNSESRNISGGFSHEKISVHGSGHDEYSRRLIEEISRSISLHQTFQPHKAPALPNNLIWYNGELSWQRLYRQRMEGGLHTHEERIETKKSQIVDNREMKEIKGELKSLFANMDVAFDKTEEAKFEQQENAVLAISVKFAPLSQLTGNTTSTPNDKMFSANEQKYIDEVKECLDDGEITQTGRRLLKLYRERLGINESRAAELEASVTTPQLTDNEKEYLKAYQEANENGQISDKERRTLNRLRDALGISEERAKEIEQLIQ